MSRCCEDVDGGGITRLRCGRDVVGELDRRRSLLPECLG
jgi:hypothetical protein